MCASKIMNNDCPVSVSNVTDIFATFIVATERHDAFKPLRTMPLQMIVGDCFVSRAESTGDCFHRFAVGELVKGVVLTVDTELPDEREDQFKAVVALLEMLDDETISRLESKRLVLVYNNTTVVADVDFKTKHFDYWCYYGLRVILPFQTAPETDEETEIARAYVKSIMFDLLTGEESACVTLLPENSNKEEALG